MPDPSNSGEPVSSILGTLGADELFARGMQSVKMTGGGGLSSWEPPTTAEAARLFPNYEILDLIGRGGMGAVYKARQLALDRIVAIKLLPLEVSVDRDFAERFKREARTMAKMNHPNIVSVFDFGTTSEGHLFFVMEFVEGTTLHHLIKTTGLKPAQALEIIVGVCEALHYAHLEHVVHRDIKPANVLVDVRGRVKVTDFGLARLSTPSAAEQAGYTMTGTVLGTPDYMAPEQKRGMHVDHRADIYSLGVMLYEMLCGNVPQGVFDLPSRLVSVDERVDQVVIRAMQQEPERRYQNTEDMRHEVQTIRQAKDPNARAPRPRDGFAPAPSEHGRRSRNFAPLAIGLGAAAVVTVVAVMMNKGNHHDPAPRSGSTTPLAKVEPAKPPSEPEKTSAVPPEKSPANTPPPEPVKPTVVGTKPPETVTPPNPAPSPAPVTPVVVKPPEPRNVTNPEMAAAVAQLGPGGEPGQPAVSATGEALTRWQKLSDHGDLLVKRRDPDGAIEVYRQAIVEAERASPPAPIAEVGRMYSKIGALEAGIGSVDEARATLEGGKKFLQRAKSNGKLDEDTNAVLIEIEGRLRKLPKE